MFLGNLKLGSIFILLRNVIIFLILIRLLLGPLRQHSDFDVRWDDFAIALKTGKEVALQRTPLLLMTFLSDFRNKIIIGEAANVTIGRHQMVNVYDYLDYKQQSDSPGWNGDAHKFLPGFKILNDRFPHAKWFVMIDDDTYIIMRNLVHLLKAYDPSKPYYFGNANVFVGCDNVKKFGEGPLFAHGGSGIVVSRAALKIMLKIVDSCISKYIDCWAGDIRLALCFRDAGILITGLPGFNGDAPNAEFSFGSDPCFPPISFHHLSLQQLQSLGQMEIEKSSKGLITMADVVEITSQPALQEETDRPGDDLNEFTASDVDSCRRKCIEDKQCVTFVFGQSKCYLKNGVPGIRKKEGYTSGFLSSRFVCKK